MQGIYYSFQPISWTHPPWCACLTLKHMTSTTFVTDNTFLVKLEIFSDVAFTLIQTLSKRFNCVLVEFVVFHSPVTCQDSWPLSNSSSICVDARLSVRFFTCLSYRKKKYHIFDVLKYLLKLIVLASVIQKWIALDKSLSSGFGFPNGYPLDSDLSNG